MTQPVITKLFVTNLPEGCTPWELRKGLESFGEITGTYVAKKRDKQGNRFGFVSFKDVRDRQLLLNSLGGVKLGDSKLKVNVARFAAENSGGHVPKEVHGQYAKDPGKHYYGSTLNLRDARSYSDVVGTSKSASGMGIGNDGSKVEVLRDKELSVVIPDRTEAFRKVLGSAIVGRTVDLETLVDLDRLLKIAKVTVANIQYLGGLSILISFLSDTSAKAFLDNKALWEPWFSKLDVWNGQSLPLERVAWLKLCGIPLHLFVSDVLVLIGERFGKIVHVPKSLEEDQDLSVCRIGVLAGEADRIKEVVSLRWKNRSYMIRVEEDCNDWIPDCLGSFDSEGSVDSSELASSPVGCPRYDWQKDDKDRLTLDDDKGSEKSLDLNGVSQELCANSYAPEQNVNVGGGTSSKLDGVGIEKGGVEPWVAQSLVDPPIQPGVGVILEKNKEKENFNNDGINKGSGPHGMNIFGATCNDSRPKKKKLPTILKNKKGVGHNRSGSPKEDSRPKKRPRSDLEDRFDLNKDCDPQVNWVSGTEELSRAGIIRDESGVGASDPIALVQDQSVGGSVSRVYSGNMEHVKDSSAATRDIDKEVEATMEMGNLVGVQLGDFSNLIRSVVGKEGINVCPQ